MSEEKKSTESNVISTTKQPKASKKRKKRSCYETEFSDMFNEFETRRSELKELNSNVETYIKSQLPQAFFSLISIIRESFTIHPDIKKYFIKIVNMDQRHNKDKEQISFLFELFKIPKDDVIMFKERQKRGRKSGSGRSNKQPGTGSAENTRAGQEIKPSDPPPSETAMKATKPPA